MDPDECLKNLLALAKRIRDEDPATGEENPGVVLAEGLEDLDEWVRKGGFLPERWMTPNRLAERVLKTAYSWWKNHRPAKWSQKTHLENPEVNTATGGDIELANAVARLVKSQGS